MSKTTSIKLKIWGAQARGEEFSPMAIAKEVGCSPSLVTSVAREVLNPVVWDKAEWDDEVLAAFWKGFELTVEADGDDFFWAVKVTSERCEWPELVDGKIVKTKSAAKRAAERAAAKADKSYGHPQY